MQEKKLVLKRWTTERGVQIGDELRNLLVSRATRQEFESLAKRVAEELPVPHLGSGFLDFRGVTLNGTFAKVDLRDCDLSYISCDKSNPERYIEFSNCSLQGSRLLYVKCELGITQCDARAATFDHSNLVGNIFRRSELRECSFAHARLNRASFAECDLTDCTFEYASAEGANFYRTVCDGTIFSFANLRRTSFEGAVTGSNTSFVGAKLEGSDLVSVDSFPIAFISDTVRRAGRMLRRHSDLSSKMLQLSEQLHQRSELWRFDDLMSKLDEHELTLVHDALADAAKGEASAE